MFDIGFPELVLVGIVALLVIGPDKLPETVRTVALWVGRLRRALANIRSEIENEIGADEIRRQLHNESIMGELKKTKNEIGGIISKAEGELNDIKQSASLKSADKTASTTPPEESETGTSNEAAPEDTEQEQSQQPPSQQQTSPDDAERDDGRKQSESGR